MRTSRIPLLSVAALLLAACGPDAKPLSPEDVAPGSSALTSSKVSVIDAAPVKRILACSGYCIYQHGFWIDLSVANEAFEKEVGVVWTRDGWRSQQVTLAKYEAPLEGNRERWGVDVLLEQNNLPSPEVEYAVFVKMNGTTYWDPLNNHYVRDSVTTQRPVRLLTSGVSFESGTGVVLTGDVRVLNLAFDKKVSVRFTTNDWATSKEVSATWVKNQDWRFRAVLGTTAPLPETVKFAVRYRVAGAEYWDNRAGSNYSHALRPKFYPVALPSEPLSGIWTVGGTFTTDLPVARTDVKVDSGVWKPGPHAVLSTADLTDGAHVAKVRVSITGGHTEYADQPFTVRNRVTPLTPWALAPVGSAQDYPWDFAFGPDQKLYVLWSSGQVARLSSATSTAAPFLYPAHVGVDRIAVDAQSRLYVMASHGAQLVR